MGAELLGGPKRQAILLCACSTKQHQVTALPEEEQ